MNLKFEKYDDLNQNTICVVDNSSGSYVAVAKRLSKFFKKTFYYSVNQSSFPRLSIDSVGTGYDDIERVDEFWGRLNEFDIIIFPDIYFSDWGKHLREIGKMVWGANESEVLETDRHLFKDELASVGLPIAKTEYIIGIANLKEYLAGVEDKWLKISYFRGELETFHHVNYNQSKQFLNEIQYSMGPMADKIEFMVEDAIKSVAEIGCDSYTINGEYPSKMIWGIEVKDCGYIGKVVKYDDLPDPVKKVNEKFKPVLKKYNHTGFYSTEVRYTERDECYYTDPCMRAGSPPSNTYLMLIDNWAEVIEGGCNGKLITPNYIATYGVEIILKSDYCCDGYLNVKYPEEYKDNIKLKGSFKLGDAEYVIPFSHCGFDMTEFGSVVCIGDNLEEVMEEALCIAGQVEAYELHFNAAALPEAIEKLADIQEILNIKF